MITTSTREKRQNAFVSSTQAEQTSSSRERKKVRITRQFSLAQSLPFHFLFYRITSLVVLVFFFSSFAFSAVRNNASFCSYSNRLFFNSTESVTPSLMGTFLSLINPCDSYQHRVDHQGRRITEPIERKDCSLSLVGRPSSLCQKRATQCYSSLERWSLFNCQLQTRSGLKSTENRRQMLPILTRHSLPMRRRFSERLPVISITRRHQRWFVQRNQ